MPLKPETEAALVALTSLTGADSLVTNSPGNLLSSALYGIEDAQRLCHGLARRSGWWREYGEMPEQYRPLWIATKVALIQSEASEALEGFRKGLNDDHLAHRKMAEVELADVLIRTLDLAGGLGLDVAGAVIEKLAYNQARADHKPENRAKEGGKVF